MLVFWRTPFGSFFAFAPFGPPGDPAPLLLEVSAEDAREKIKTVHQQPLLRALRVLVPFLQQSAALTAPRKCRAATLISPSCAGNRRIVRGKLRI